MEQTSAAYSMVVIVRLTSSASATAIAPLSPMALSGRLDEVVNKQVKTCTGTHRPSQPYAMVVMVLFTSSAAASAIAPLSPMALSLRLDKVVSK
jgi:hypothetical protein